MILEQIHECFCFGAVLGECLERNFGLFGHFDVANPSDFALSIQMENDVAFEIDFFVNETELCEERFAVEQIGHSLLGESGRDRNQIEVLFHIAASISRGGALLFSRDFHFVVFLQPEIQDDFDFVILQVGQILQFFDSFHGGVVFGDTLVELVPCELQEQRNDSVLELFPFFFGEYVAGEMLDVVDAVLHLEVVVCARVLL